MRALAGLFMLLLGVGVQANCEIATIANLNFTKESLVLDRGSKSALETAKAAAPVIKRYLVKAFDDELNAKRGVLVAYRLKHSGAEKVRIERSKDQKPGAVAIIALGPNCEIPAIKKNDSSKGSKSSANKSSYYASVQDHASMQAKNFSWKKGERLSGVIARWRGKQVVVEHYDRQLLAAGVHRERSSQAAARWLAERFACKVNESKKEVILSCGK